MIRPIRQVTAAVVAVLGLFLGGTGQATAAIIANLPTGLDASDNLSTIGGQTDGRCPANESEITGLWAQSFSIPAGSGWFGPGLDTLLLANGVPDPLPGGQQEGKVVHARMPEPSALIIWSAAGLGAAGLAAWRRRHPSRRRGWSEEDRAAIFAIIERGRTR